MLVRPGKVDSQFIVRVFFKKHEERWFFFIMKIEMYFTTSLMVLQHDSSVGKFGIEQNDCYIMPM